MADRDFAEEKGRVNNSDPDNRPLFPAPEEPHAATEERGAEAVVFTALGGRVELAFAGEAGECQGNEACLCPSEISFSGAGISGRQVSLRTRCERSAVWFSGNRQD